jgi:hypothetical protein
MLIAVLFGTIMNTAATAALLATVLNAQKDPQAITDAPATGDKANTDIQTAGQSGKT